MPDPKTIRDLDTDNFIRACITVLPRESARRALEREVVKLRLYPRLTVELWRQGYARSFKQNY
jgi:hypothetical protein